MTKLYREVYKIPEFTTCNACEGRGYRMQVRCLYCNGLGKIYTGRWIKSLDDNDNVK